MDSIMKIYKINCLSEIKEKRKKKKRKKKKEKRKLLGANK